MCGNIHGHPRNCIAGPSSWIEMTMLLPPWAIEKAPSMRQLTLKHNIGKLKSDNFLHIHQNSNWYPWAKMASHHISRPVLFTLWLEALYSLVASPPKGYKASLLSVVCLPFTESPPLRGPHYNMKANKLAVRSFLKLLSGYKASVL